MQRLSQRFAGCLAMLSDFTGAEKVYIACGYTDIRKGIDGLAAMVQQEFELDPYNGPINLDHGIEKMREHFQRQI